jgi:CRISPR-associated endonuclease/helicase Cas3
LPIALWAQNWKWLNTLAEDWGCSFVFGSGSLVRFWEIKRVIGDGTTSLPDLVPKNLAKELQRTERGRIAYRTLGVVTLASLVHEVTQTKGPRLLILNTLEGAAKVAHAMRQAMHDVVHLSTALSPRDRNRILEEVKARLADPDDHDWTLVATSLVEAGVNLSFRTGFRERFSVSSMVQTGGRVNRHGEYDQGVVADFMLRADTGIAPHPAAEKSGSILGEYFEQHRLDGEFDVAKIVTDAIDEEARRLSDSGKNDLVRAEKVSNYPEVAMLGKVIKGDTRLVVVDGDVRSRLEAGGRVPSQELLLGSVQIRKNIIDDHGLPRLETRREIYFWPDGYDPAFLGYMGGVLNLIEAAPRTAFRCRTGC